MGLESNNNSSSDLSSLLPELPEPAWLLETCWQNGQLGGGFVESDVVFVDDDALGSAALGGSDLQREAAPESSEDATSTACNERVPAPVPKTNVVSNVDDARLVPAHLVELNKRFRGLPVFQVGNETLVFVAHLLVRVLSCACRAKKQFGLFRDKVFSKYRRQVPTKRWRMQMHKSAVYESYCTQYPLSRFKEPSVAITLEGLNAWLESGKMDMFLEREAAKCAVSCVEDHCTCDVHKDGVP